MADDFVIRQAQSDECGSVINFYCSALDMMAGDPHAPQWQKHVYPADSYLCHAIDNHELWIGEHNGVLAASMVCNHECNPGYIKAPWRVAAKEEEICIIHVLCVHPSYGRRGFAKLMARKALQIARQSGSLAVRLDVRHGTPRAEKVYEAVGFEKIGDMTLYYPTCGSTGFSLYEYDLALKD